MGMSAAQARLLSITTRLNNNEFRSQTITNSKLRLADKSSEASQEYMDALNSQKLVYSYFDDNGESTQLNMTPGLIYTYSPLKNQYALMNSSGKILVSAKDKENFEQSADLNTFLGNYGLSKDTSSLEKYNKDLKDYDNKTGKYKELFEKYDAEMEEYNSNLKEYNEKLTAYNNALNKPDLYKLFSGIVGTSDTVQNTGAQGHYYRALKDGNAGCYLHVLNVLLDYNGTTLSNGTFTASNGESITLDGQDGGMTSDMSLDEKNTMSDISGLLGKCECDGDDDFNTEGQQNRLLAVRESGNEPEEIDILRSDYIEINNPDGTYSYKKKTLEQKIIDMYYIIKNKTSLNISREDMDEMLMNLTDGDMQKITPPHPGNPPTPPVEPQKPTPPEYESTLNDKDKAQWYVNLWHMMNGSETANLVETTEYKYQNSDDLGDVHNETIFTVKNAVKNPQTANYDTFDDNLINNSDWLQFALEHGIVSLAKAEFVDPSADSGKTPELTSKGITWKSTIFTNAVDFKYVDDDAAIAIAEVKYKNAMREIENQDKKYDQDLKKLDTEHTAMQTEYDSIKEAMNKNVERSFKAFS